MRVTLSLDDELVKKVREIAAARGMKLTAMIRGYVGKVAAEDSAPGRHHQEREALERSFRKFQFKFGKRQWRREDLHVRS